MLANTSAIFGKVAFVMFLLTSVILTGVVGGAAAQASTAKTTHNSSSSDSRVTASVYCVHGTVTVKGWEQDLVKRNPGLRRFNWSPITAAKPSVLIFRRPAQNQMRPSQTVKRYHYANPIVLSYAEMREARKIHKIQEAQRAPQAQEVRPVQAVQAQLVSTYTGASLNQPASYVSAYSALDNQRKVHGRLISSHF